MEELQEGIDYAHARGAKVYVAANMVTHEGNEIGAGEWFRQLRDLGLDAVIVSDPALIVICSTEARVWKFICQRKLHLPITRPLNFGKPWV